MTTNPQEPGWKSFLTERGTLVALVLLCVFFSLTTISRQPQSGSGSGGLVAERAIEALGANAELVVLAGSSAEDKNFAEAAREALTSGGLNVAAAVTGDPSECRTAVEERLAADGTTSLAGIVCTGYVADQPWIVDLSKVGPAFTGVKVFAPDRSYWPNFLTFSNLVNLPDQISLYAILAIGMTLVIITGGIDLSVGSLVALSAVSCAVLFRDWLGGANAGVFGMIAATGGAIVVGGVAGFLSGAVVTVFRIPPFIVTLSMMMIASGLAYIFAGGATIPQVPTSFQLFASGHLIPRVPNTVTFMVVLYAIAHVVMTRTVFGRYVYAVGGNSEAARLSGVPVKRILLLVYTICGLLAGLVGVLYTSQFHSASARYGEKWELTVIAAVVVGGTSLFGGEGRILGTLVGALLLAVIFNGMNLLGLETYPQMVVLGLVIVCAAILDTWKKR